MHLTGGMAPDIDGQIRAVTPLCDLTAPLIPPERAVTLSWFLGEL